MPPRQQRKPLSLRSRLLFTYLLLVLLGVSGLILWTGIDLQKAVVEQAEHDLEIEALIIANALHDPLEKWQEGTSDGGRTLDVLVLLYAQSVGVRVTVLDVGLQTLFSSDEAVGSGSEHQHPELVAAQTGEEQHDIRWDEWSDEERLFVAAPIHSEDGQLEGIVQLSLPMTPVYKEIRQTWLRLIMVGSIIVLATALVSLLVARQVVRPIRRLKTVTEAMAGGALDQQVTPEGPDEIERLGWAFNRMSGQIRGMLARQQAFVANAAHELRSPLASLLLRVEMLQKHGLDNPEMSSRYLGQMGQEVEHLARLVDHLLTLSSLDEGREMARRPLDLAPALYELAEEVGPLVDASDLELRLEVPPHLPAVLVNSESIRIAVHNLLDNAIKYTPAGGLVVLEAWAEARPLLALGGARAARLGQRRPLAPAQNAEGARGSVVIQVRDSGSGIPAAHLSHIFERFYRVEGARVNRPGGAGLGLSLVRSIVESHGGQVTAASVEGEGTTFTIHLPAAAESTPQYHTALDLESLPNPDD